MRNLNEYFVGLKPIFNTITFEIKKQRKKFYVFLIIVSLVIVLTAVTYGLTPSSLQLNTQTDFFIENLFFVSQFLTSLVAILFFSGIICSEFDKKTGHIVFPKINKYKLIVGKYLGNLVLVVSIITIYYFMLGILGLYYFEESISIRFFYSYGIALLYISVLSSFVTFFSSFMKSVTLTIVITLVLLLFVFTLVQMLLTFALNGIIEPLYSLPYLGSLITNILENPFPDPRYGEFSSGGMGPGGSGGGNTIRFWMTPSVGMGITFLLVYIVVFFILAALLFKRRQL